MSRMTDAHLHKLQWIRLCDGHAGHDFCDERNVQTI